MPVTKSNHNLIKICKRKYRNPIYLAREWRGVLDDGEYTSSAALARHLKVTRARVTQIMNLLKLSPEVIVACPPKRSPVLVLDWKIRKGVIDGQEILHTGANHQQAARS